MYDDALLCELCDPPLSSVRPDPEEIGCIKVLLAETDLPLERIADLVGFSQANYLSHAFKLETGETARDDRRR